MHVQQNNYSRAAGLWIASMRASACSLMGLTPAEDRPIKSASPEINGLSQMTSARLRPWCDIMTALLLFVATAIVIVWQNSRLQVLFDISYILENSYRISLGDFPYRDFPFVHAPLTYLIQAELIKLTGRVFFHHVIYCMVVGGLATVLTWRILLNLLRGRVRSARLVAFLLGAPLTVLGICCILPQPFYDSDCMFAILVCILFLQQAERKGFPPLRTFLAGMLLTVPLFVKQNTGLAFLISAGLAFALLMSFDMWRHRPFRGYVWIMLGAAAGLLLALLLIHVTVGIATYTHWTVQYAASRRLRVIATVIQVYNHKELLVWFVPFAGWLLLSRNRQSRNLDVFAGFLFSAPFIALLIDVFIDRDLMRPAKLLLAFWPLVLILSAVFALLNIRRERGIASVLPFIVIGTANGAFLSQGLVGSTYALWPLLMLLIASTMTAFISLRQDRRPFSDTVGFAVAFASIVAVSMLISGGSYVWHEVRLNYAKVSEGYVTQSSLPALAGLYVSGPWIPQFEELVRFTQREIPADQGILMLPGEDIFYYATGRHPRFPVLQLDSSIYPYSPQEILELTRAQDIRWLVVKRNLQLKFNPMINQDPVLEELRKDFEPVVTLDNYDVYKRKGTLPFRGATGLVNKN